MIEKKDWVDLKKQIENQHKNMLLALEQDLVLLKLCDKKIDEFVLEEAKDKAPDVVKEIIKEVTDGKG